MTESTLGFAVDLTPSQRRRSLAAVIAGSFGVGVLVGAAVPLIALRLEAAGVDATWIGVNSAMIRLFTRGHDWRIDGVEHLRRDGRYLVLANHQSWVDIVVLQDVFNRRIPFLKFFLKQQLIWVPVLGLAWWALDFPFMRRYTREELERHPEWRGRDVEAFLDDLLQILGAILALDDEGGVQAGAEERGQAEAIARSLRLEMEKLEPETLATLRRPATAIVMSLAEVERLGERALLRGLAGAGAMAVLVGGESRS